MIKLMRKKVKKYWENGNILTSYLLNFNFIYTFWSYLCKKIQKKTSLVFHLYELNLTKWATKHYRNVFTSEGKRAFQIIVGVMMLLCCLWVFPSSQVGFLILGFQNMVILSKYIFLGYNEMTVERNQTFTWIKINQSLEKLQKETCVEKMSWHFSTACTTLHTCSLFVKTQKWKLPFGLNLNYLA